MAAGDDDWDLSAVVRSCNSATASAADPNATAREDALSSLASLTFNDQPNDAAFSFSDIFQPKPPVGFHELQQAYMSFLPNPADTTTAMAAAAAMPLPLPTGPAVQILQGRHFGQGIKPIRPRPDLIPTAASCPPPLQLHQRMPPPPPLQQHRRQPPPRFQPNFPSSPMTQSHTPKSRKRKNQQKRTVCHATADNLSTDMWAWRKYGQKPIKGSPYPRNYYRCSSSKGCGARKQVERSYTDPDTFVITYTGDHSHPRPTHRNSLAGSSRTKAPISPKNLAGGDPDQLSTMAMAGSGLSPTSPITPQNEDDGEKETSGGEKEGEAFEDMEGDSEDDEEDILIPNLAVRDGIFVGYEKLGGSPKRRPP